MPGESILKEEVFAKANKKNQWLNVDISNQAIEVDTSGFFIAMEIIDIGQKGIKRKKVNGKYDHTYGATIKECVDNENECLQTFIFDSNQGYWRKWKIYNDDSCNYPLIAAYIIFK